jgi:hypothetical protein
MKKTKLVGAELICAIIQDSVCTENSFWRRKEIKRDIQLVSHRLRIPPLADHLLKHFQRQNSSR